MKIVIASDHRGFKLKEHIKRYLTGLDHEILDAGCGSEERTDYPLHVLKAGSLFKKGEAEKGVLVCGSGLGVCIAANKLRGIRAVTARQPSDAEMGVRHNKANFLCLGADITPVNRAEKIVKAFLDSVFEGGRHQKRIEMIKEIEKESRV
ncbi:MAG: ribose 5-phosphate isomerase B [Elusimicrobiota bacterium]